MKKFLAVLMLGAVLISGCGAKEPKHISQDEARSIMASNPQAIIVDVRAQDEYDKKHIPNALLVPIDDLRAGDFSKLPDKNAPLLVYCWTGRRAEEAAKILVDNGYQNVSDLGGLVDWTGVTEGVENTYTHISQEEAVKMLEENPDAILIDCRFPKDYEARHIPNAMFVPLESVLAEDFSKIPDKNATLITYCGDGNRARKTAQALVDRGYTHVYEMGGIKTWTGEVEGTDVN